jgi:TonB-dependent receptor
MYIRLSLLLSFLVYFLPLFLFSNSFAQSGVVQGRVIDFTSGEKLVGANVMVKETVIGAATNVDGEFRIESVPVGKQIIKTTYLGYNPNEMEVEVFEDRVIEIVIQLNSEVIEGEEVVVTGQLKGQQRAINEQLSSNTIVNVVSKDKLQELPDQNAAETLARLPGIALERNAGEGSKVIIRGLTPKLNSITMNGERIPSTDPFNRSVDLSMISTEMLEGIEVFKALTPDMDGDAVGGTVNFVTRKAPDKTDLRLKLQGGYNNHASDWGIYQGTGAFSQRFLDNKFGLLITGNIEQRNRSSHQLTGNYSFGGEEPSDLNTARVNVNNLNLGDIIETRKRWGFSLAADYQLGVASNIFLSSFWNRTDRDELRRRKRYRVGSSYVEYDLRDRQIETTLWTNTLQGNHNLLGVAIDWRGSYSKTRNFTPFEHFPRFRELAAFTGDLIDDQGPELIPEGAKNDTSSTWFKWDYINNQDVNEDSYTLQLDLDYDYQISNNVTGHIKTGGKLRSRDRTFDDNSIWTSHFRFIDLGIEMLNNPDFFRQNYRLYTLADNNNAVGFYDFIDPNFSTDNYLDGAFDLSTGINPAMMEDYYNVFKDYILANGDPLYTTDPLADLNDYNAGEKIYAAYLMADINFGPRIMLLGGVRYEKTQNDYKSVFGTPVISDEGQSVSGVTDTAGNRSYDNWLPMVHLRYKATDWMDIRLAYTNTIARPDYFNLVPKEIINGDDLTITIGDPNLKPTNVHNYDIFVSFYNRYGLFTVGGFYKDLYDIDYQRRFPKLGDAPPWNSYSEVGPINSEYKSTVKGFEIELQTNLVGLPSPFNGIILYVNYSRIWSETFYPFVKVETRFIPVPPFVEPVVTDTVRSGKVVGQADYLANVTIGYEKGGFSGRLTMFLQGRILDELGPREEFDSFTEAVTRWDLALRQNITQHFAVFLTVNNLSNVPETALLGFRDLSTRQEFYGWTADFGFQYKL